MALFPDLGVHEKTEPEGLQDPEDEALRSVEKAKPEKVAIYKKGKRTHEERHAIVFLAKIPLALRGVAAGVGLKTPGRLFAVQFSYFAVRPAIVPRDPLRQGHADVVDHRAVQLAAGAAREQEVLIVFAVFAAPTPLRNRRRCQVGLMPP